MAWRWLLTVPAALLAGPLIAAPASSADRFYIGNYQARTEDDWPTRCQVDLVWANDVGGEVVARGCAAWPDLADAARWWVDGSSGDAIAQDALRKTRFRVTETEAGFVAILSDETRVWLEPIRVRARKTRS